MVREIKEGEKCTRLTGTIDGDNKAKLYNKWSVMTDPVSKNVTGVKLDFIQGDICEANPTEFYKIIYEVKCDSAGKDNEITLNFAPLKEDTLTACKYTISGSAKAACPFLNYYIVSAFFSQYASFLGALIMIIGIVFFTVGLKFIFVTIVVTCSFAVALILFLFIFNIFTISEYYHVWIILGVGLVIGALLGFFLLKAIKVCFFIIGACFGYTIGIFLSTFILEWVSWNPEILYWIIICVSILCFGLLTMWIVKHALIVATSFMGAYLFCRGLSLYVGGFPDENTIMDLIKKQEWDKLADYRTPAVYGYLAGIVVLTIIGIVIQEKMNKDKDNSHYTKQKD